MQLALRLSIAARRVSGLGGGSKNLTPGAPLISLAQAAPARPASKKAAAPPPPPPPPAAKSLAAVLELELKYEKEEGAGSSEATMAEIRAELAEWKFDVAPLQARFSATKRFGAQEVRLDLDCTPMPADEDDEGAEEGAEGDEAGGAEAPASKAEEGGDGDDDGGEAPPDGYRMLVTIKEAGKATTMQVGCFLGAHLRVHRVTLFPAGKEPTSDVIFGGVDELPLYAGPNFDELDQAVQNAFYEYLADRGVDDALAERLADFAQAKEQSEYVNWLAAARDFAKAK